MTRIVAELAEPRAPHRRRHRPAVVPRPPRRTRMDRPARPYRAHAVGHDPPAAPVSGRRQARSRPAGARLRRVLRPRRVGGAGRGRLVPPGRCRDRDVAAAHDGRHRAARRLVPPGAARVQHPGRVPRRRGHHRRDHQPRRDRRRRAGWSGISYRLADAVTVLSDDLRANVVAKLPTAGANAVQDDPQLRRHRSHPPRRPDDRLPGRARHRRRAGAALRRQRRLLAVRRAAGRSRPPRCPGSAS